MSRPKALKDTLVKWAFEEWRRGCTLEDVAAVLEVTRWTLYREFKTRGWKKPCPIPDENWIMPYSVAK